MRPTLVVIHSLQIGARQFRHGEELEPNLLPPEEVDSLVDRKQLIEYDSSERRSLYRLLHRFSGCSETERLSNEELAVCALT